MPQGRRRTPVGFRFPMEKIVCEFSAGLTVSPDVEFPLCQTYGHWFTAGIDHKKRYYLFAKIILNLAGNLLTNIAHGATALHNGEQIRC